LYEAFYCEMTEAGCRLAEDFDNAIATAHQLLELSERCNARSKEA